MSGNILECYCGNHKINHIIEQMVRTEDINSFTKPSLLTTSNRFSRFLDTGFFTHSLLQLQHLVNVLQDLVCALHALGISPTEQEVANEA